MIARRNVVRALVVGALVIAAIGCEQIIGADFGSKPVGECSPATPPGPPTTAGGGDGFTITAAVHTLDFGDPIDGAAPYYGTIGFDLDGRCTSVFDSPLCEPNAWTGSTAVDGVNGIDNQVGALLVSETNVFNSAPFNSSFMNEQTQSGAWAPMAVVRVSDYDGYAVDDEVTVDVLIPVPLASPKWDGTDAYAIDPSSGAPGSVDGGDAVVARFTDSHGYVDGFELVAHIGASELRIANVLFKLTDLIVTAHLQPIGSGQFSLQGVLAGHGRNDDLLAVLPALTQSFPGTAICADSSLYPLLKRWICSNADSLVDGGTGPCNAASLGVRFDTAPIRIAGVATLPDAGPLCDAATDPANDTCTIPATQ